MIDPNGCDLGRVSRHSPDIPDGFQNVSDNENCENADITQRKFLRE